MLLRLPLCLPPGACQVADCNQRQVGGLVLEATQIEAMWPFSDGALKLELYKAFKLHTVHKYYCFKEAFCFMNSKSTPLNHHDFEILLYTVDHNMHSLSCSCPARSEK